MWANLKTALIQRLTGWETSKHEAWTNVVVILGQRRRRWTNNKIKMLRRLIFAGKQKTPLLSKWAMHHLIQKNKESAI